MNNCRNCIHAKWFKHPSGRRCFESFARCEAPLPDMSKMPLSVRGVTFNEMRSVASNDNIELNCPAWAKEIKS